MRITRRPTLVTAGALGTAALALSASGTLSGFTASITNSTNTGGVGSLVMQETGPDGNGGTATCLTTASATSATCATINKYGGDLNMNTTSNATKVTAIAIKNAGTMNAGTFTLTPGACTLTNTASNTGDLCTEAVVTIKQDGTQIFTGTPAALASGGPLTLATTNVTAGGTSNVEITFATTAATDAVQGESVSQPLTWTFNA
ncbi:hypothetical protein [Arsenicicoccus dermatophilus]|uniref:hypothetical protein n=1 Tax=Arsenicicoccus dermatophilus TaxID=1076331 RepID=UPI003916E50C